MLVTSRHSVTTTQQPPLSWRVTCLPGSLLHTLWPTLGWADLLELALPCEPVALLFSVLTLLPHTLEAVASARH